MANLKLAGQPGALDTAASIAQFQEQIATLNDLMRQLAGNAFVSAGANAQADPLSAPFTLYVNPYIGSDNFVGGSYNSFEAGNTDEEIIASKLKRIELQRLECGYTPQRPFKTMNRAVIEAAIITSKNWYTYTDPRAHVDCVSIVPSPGVHTIYNNPGNDPAAIPVSLWASGKIPTWQELISFNPTSGGLLLPRGCSIAGPDLRKVTFRPSWVPANQDEAADYSNRSGIFRVTGTGYFFGFTFMDKVGWNFSHHLLDCFHFASKSELDGFYEKITISVGAPADLSVALTKTRGTEYQIVGPIEYGDNPVQSWDTTASASPYIFNCSIRSDYGIGGIFADGAKVSGLKSIVTAQFTGVSLQKDMSCWEVYSNGSWRTAANYSEYISTDPDNVRMKPSRISRHIQAVNDAFIQEVSVFAIGQGIHHYTDAGGEITITNSNSSFGGCGAISKGYKGFAFPQDKNWNISRIKSPVTIAEKTGNVRRIYLGVVESVTANSIALSSPLASDESSDTVPALLLKDKYTLKTGTKIWIENPKGDDWRADLSPNAWSSGSADVIRIAAAPLQADNNQPVGVDPVTNKSLAIGRRVYIRRVIDTRTPSERRISLLLRNSSSARIPERNFILQTDPSRSNGAISRELTKTGDEVLIVTNSGAGPLPGAGVSKTCEMTVRRGAPNVNYAVGEYYSAGAVVKYAGKHYQSLRNQITTSIAPDQSSWGEAFVHMPSAYDAEDPLRNESPIITLDTDTDPLDFTADCGIDWDTVWTDPSEIRSQYRNGTDYLGAHALLVALGFSPEVAHEALVPRLVADRERDPASAIDFPTAPSGGAATGRGNWAVEFRRPSTLRLYGHAWEWAGFLNYSKAIPAAQRDLGAQNKFTYYFTNWLGGRVVPQGSNEDGFNISPRGLEDIETGATISPENIGIDTIDDAQSTDFDTLTANNLTVRNLFVLGDNQINAANPDATTENYGLGQLANIQELQDARPAQNDADINRAKANLLNTAGLEYWRTNRRLISGPAPGTTLVVLHVAASTPITGINSVPAGYQTTNHTYEGATGDDLQGEIFPTVTAALERASRIYVPVGAEIIISVHDSLNAIEAGPLMLGNSSAPFVIAGARGAVNPKIVLSGTATVSASTRLPQYSAARLYSAGAIFQDIQIDIEDSRSGYLTFNGGFGVCGRNVGITWKNVASNSTIANATGSYGGQVVFRIFQPLATGSAGDRQIYTRIEPATGATVNNFSVIGQSAGLLGHGLSILFDFLRAEYGVGGRGTLIWKFENTSTAPVPISFLGCGGRGACSIGGRLAPMVKWDFSNSPWEMNLFFAPFTYVKNYCGLAFKTIPVASGGVSGLTNQSATTIFPVQLSKGCTVDGATTSGTASSSGPFSLYLELQGRTFAGRTFPAAMIIPKASEGSYLYGASQESE